MIFFSVEIDRCAKCIEAAEAARDRTGGTCRRPRRSCDVCMSTRNTPRLHDCLVTSPLTCGLSSCAWPSVRPKWRRASKSCSNNATNTSRSVSLPGCAELWFLMYISPCRALTSFRSCFCRVPTSCDRSWSRPKSMARRYTCRLDYDLT